MTPATVLEILNDIEDTMDVYVCGVGGDVRGR